MGFRDYAEKKNAEVLIERCATIASQMDLDIDAFIEGFVEDIGLSEDWNSFKTGVKQAASGAWDMIKNFGPVKAGTKALNNAFDDKHRKAINALRDLHQFLSNNKQAKGVVSKNKSNMSVTDYIGDLSKSLERESGISRLANGVEATGSGTAPDMAARMKQWQDSQAAGGQASQGGNAAAQTAPVTYGVPPHLRARRVQNPQTNATSVMPSNSGALGS